MFQTLSTSSFHEFDIFDVLVQDPPNKAASNMQTFVGGDSRLEEQTGAETWPSQDTPAIYSDNKPTNIA